MPYKPSSIWTHKRQNKFQTECISADCEVTAFSFKKYKDGLHFHDAGGPEGFDDWYREEGYNRLHILTEEEYEAYDCTDLDKLAKRAAQLVWEVSAKVIR